MRQASEKTILVVDLKLDINLSGSSSRREVVFRKELMLALSYSCEDCEQIVLRGSVCLKIFGEESKLGLLGWRKSRHVVFDQSHELMADKLL